MITPLFVMFRKTILTQEVTMDFYFLINCSISLYNGPPLKRSSNDYFLLLYEFNQRVFLKESLM